ncbi:MAG: FAD binding domain-containing protein [Cyclobacteriaceae bacterium]|nr:FAD binding domain-containing protein [Cyclobacteriaceae bacterium]
MNKFKWFNAQNIEEALERTNATVSDAINRGSADSAIIKSGGIELLDFIKEGIIEPAEIINIKSIPGLEGIAFDRTAGLRIGANTTLADIENNGDIKLQYLALHQAVSKAATPQLRNVSTLGGNIAQRTRCWYFRSIDHPCFRKGGTTCFAQNGENQMHAIMNNGTCCSVHASSVATALLAYGATVEITSRGGQKKDVSIDDFFVNPFTDIRRESVLRRGEIITAVNIPAQGKNVKSWYIKQGERASFDWALADVAVVVELSGKRVRKAAIAMGAASPVPVRSKAAEEFITGKDINATTAAEAGQKAMENATPLAKNGYKVDLFKTIVKRALLESV